MASALPLQWSTSFYNLSFSLKNKNVGASAVTVIHHKHNQFLWRGEVSVAVAFILFFFFLLSEETCRDCESGVWESCLEQAGRFPLSLCGLCKPPVPFAEDGNSIDLLLQVLGVIYDKEHTTQWSGWVSDIRSQTK